jgi:lipoyl(octanoyl) transferase
MWVINLGLVPYDEALDLQHRLVVARRAGRIEDVLLLLEHPPVITLGRRGDQSNIIAAPRLLDQLGVVVRRVERGGDVTYHGPGQLVGYPILNLQALRPDVGWYVRSLEEVLIRTLADFGIAGYRIPGLVGVWVNVDKQILDARFPSLDAGDSTSDPTSNLQPPISNFKSSASSSQELVPGKILAIGARIESWVTYHGFALNVNTNMSHFDLIVPCGIHDKAVVSMHQLLGGPVDFARVRQVVAQRFGEVFGVALQAGSPEDLEV